MRRIIFSLLAVCPILSTGFCQIRLLDTRKDSTLIQHFIRLDEELHFINESSQPDNIGRPDVVNEKIPTANQFIQGLINERGQAKTWTKQESINYNNFIRDLYSWNMIPQSPDLNWPLSKSEWSLYRRKMDYLNSFYSNRYDFIPIIQWRERNGD